MPKRKLSVEAAPPPQPHPTAAPAALPSAASAPPLSAPPPPPPSAPTPPLPDAEPEPEQEPEREPEAPIVQLHLDLVEEAKARAARLQAEADTPVNLPATPGHNTLGQPLRDALPHPYAPKGERLIPVRIEVDGRLGTPPVDRTFTDEVLWNALDDNFTPETFARLTCEEEGLPLHAFEQPIVAQIRRATATMVTSSAPTAAGSAGTAGGASASSAEQPDHDERIVTIELHLEHASGVRLDDKCLWDLRDEAQGGCTPEAFARQLCTDLDLPDLEGAVGFAMREQVADARQRHQPPPPSDAARAAASADGIVRAECEVPDWTPVVTAMVASAPGLPSAVDAIKDEPVGH